MPDNHKKADCFNCDLKLNLFCYMDENQLTKVNKNRQEVYFKAGETILKNGSPLTHLICVTKGLVKVYIEDPNSDKKILIRIVKPVELILGPGFLTDGRHHITAVALEDTSACFVEIADHKMVMESNPEYSIAIVQKLNEEIIRYFEKFSTLAHKHTHGKMAETLLYLSESIYGSDYFETKLSRQDMAELSGMTKETTIRVIKEFAEEGMIVCNQNKFEILNKEKLSKISKSG